MQKKIEKKLLKQNLSKNKKFAQLEQVSELYSKEENPSASINFSGLNNQDGKATKNVLLFKNTLSQSIDPQINFEKVK